MKRRRQFKHPGYMKFFFTTFIIMVILAIAIPPAAPLIMIAGTALIFFVWLRLGIWKK
jgi:hypothetical protein